MNERYASAAHQLLNSSTFFPNRHRVLAELRPHSQTIHLHQVLPSEFLVLRNTKQFAELSGKIGTITHELTHWFDLVATVWGQEYIVDLFDAYEAAFNHRQGAAEYEWWKVIRLLDRDRRTMGLRYYKVVNSREQEHGLRNPWGLSYSVGREFDAAGRVNDAAPIFFARFSHSVSKELIARVPLSVGALLEVRAVHFEKVDEFAVLGLNADEETRRVDQGLKGHEWERTFYDPELVDYTVAAHVLSSNSGTSEPITTYRLATALAGICLNLTSQNFSKILIPSQLGFIDQSIGKAFLHAENRGFAFACLAFAAPAYNEGMDEETWLETTLAAVGLPDRATLDAAAVARLEELRATLTTRWRMDKTRDHLLEVGRQTLPIRLKLAEKGVPARLNQAGVRFPPMFDAEGNAFFQYASHTDEILYDPFEMFDCEADLWKFTDNFMAACRGSSLSTGEV